MTARDWSGGYPVKQGYSASIQPQMAPRNLALVLLARNLLPPPFEGAFRYAELGCGTGVTLAALAAVYPEAEFLGIDFMPGHVAEARRLASEAGLDNIRFGEADFATLATEPAPGGRFDYVALHGVYTWVSPENKRNIVSILDRWTRPGGVAYLGYNAHPGWLTYEPLRRILHDVLGEAEDVAALTQAREAVEGWLPALGSDGLIRFWDRVKGMSDRYLLHEFAGQHGGAMWSVDLADDMKAAKLSLCGSAALAENFDALLFSDENLAKLREADAAGFGATARDLLMGRSFRLDVFSRGAPALSEAETAARLSDWTVQAWPPLLRNEAADTEEVKLRALNTKTAKALNTALGSGERTVGEVVDGLKGDPRKARQTVLVGLARGEIMPVRTAPLAKAAAAGAARFNALARRRFDDGARLPGVASPRLGTGVAVSFRDMQAAYGGGKTKDAKTVRAGLGRLGVHVASSGRKPKPKSK